jgi:hypothetical protein
MKKRQITIMAVSLVVETVLAALWAKTALAEPSDSFCDPIGRMVESGEVLCAGQVYEYAQSFHVLCYSSRQSYAVAADTPITDVLCGNSEVTECGENDESLCFGPRGDVARLDQEEGTPVDGVAEEASAD